jgi:hypothetical protein
MQLQRQLLHNLVPLRRKVEPHVLFLFFRKVFHLFRFAILARAFWTLSSFLLHIRTIAHLISSFGMDVRVQ